ncbi:hypothetical protein [Parasediminibacterium sp. JCM 36343]|uniref:hypothetical protein n=1 Tax=Parasediminibacterium sp. JCM 36343 TaxID=3374279 RepID=UPI00397BB6AF
MNTFSNIKELLSALYRERDLLAEMFKKRTSLSYKLDFALELLEHKQERLDYLIDHAVIRQNGQFLEIDDQFLQFFEQILEVNDEINVSYINENIQSVQQNINYYLEENNDQRKYNYLRTIKNTLRKIGAITLRNVVDLKRNLETTFKNEPNYKIKKAKLETLDRKRLDISALIEQTEQLVTNEEVTFFKSALDEELGSIITQLRLQLGKCTHNLIDIEKQIIDFLNQIKYQSSIIEKLRQVKYLKDQFTLEANTNFKMVLAQQNALVFEPNPSYPLRLSIGYLLSDEEVRLIIEKVASRNKTGATIKQALAGNIAPEYLGAQIAEEIFINLEEVKNSFLASGNNLFDFISSYTFAKEVSFDESVTIYCQMVSQFEALFEISQQIETKNQTELTMVYPK